MELKEDLLHHIWKYRLYNVPLLDLDDIPVEVLDPGHHNLDSGPDFFASRIRSEGILWAGNVEVHKRASQWYLHEHHLNPAFDNVILHVVLDPDCQVKNSKGREIRTAKLDFAPAIRFRYELIMENTGYIPCWKNLQHLDKVKMNFWLERLLLERLEERTELINRAFEQCNREWDEVLYRFLARAFGQKTNADPFEMLARSVSIRIIRESCPDLISKEAILFGQAGFLRSIETGSNGKTRIVRSNDRDGYFRELCSRYRFLQRNLDIKPIDNYLWKFLRLRPVNFPTIRISQFACFLETYPDLYDRLMDLRDPYDFVMKMDIRASGYWSSHYRFHQESPMKEKKVGESRLRGLLLNAILPVLFASRHSHDHEGKFADIQSILTRIPPEENHIIRMWKSLGTEVPDGFSSQALLQLTNKYCKFKSCLSCYAGNQIIQSSDTEK